MKKFLFTFIFTICLVCLITLSASALSLNAPYESGVTYAAIYNADGKMVSFEKVTANQIAADIPENGSIKLANFESAGALPASKQSVLLDLSGTAFSYDVFEGTLTLSGAGAFAQGGRGGVVADNPWLIIAADKIVIKGSVGTVYAGVLQSVRPETKVVFDGTEAEFKALISGTLNKDVSFTESDVLYTVTFICGDNSASFPVAQGSVPAFDGSTAKPGYKFMGWRSSLDGKVYTALPAASANVVYTAVYEEVLTHTAYYTVTWDVGGNRSYETYEEGSTPVYSGSTAKAADAQYTYTFSGWSPAISEVTGNATYTAVYELIPVTATKYTVTFVVNGVSTSVTVDEGRVPAFGGSTARPGYRFTGWRSSIDSRVYTALPAASADVTYTAVYELIPVTATKYTVTFVVNGVSTPVTVEEGSVPVFGGSTEKASTESEVFTFKGWGNESGVLYTGELPAATENAVYTAQYAVTARKYTVKFIVEGVETALSVEYGKTPVFDGTPEKTGYTFAGWSPAIAPVTGDAVYTAQFTENPPAKVTITFITHDQSFKREFDMNAAVTVENPPYYTENGTRMVFGGWRTAAGAEYKLSGGTVTLPNATANETYTAIYITNDGDDGWGPLH